jgi:galactonate dehydratase
MSSIVDSSVYSARISGKTIWTFVAVHDDAGATGWGEATLHGEAPAIPRHVERLTPSLTGLVPDTALPRLAVAAIRDLAEAAAVSALDQALNDLAAQGANVPLAARLGTPRTARVPLYANINRGTLDRTPEGFAARAREVANNGFDAVKIAPFDDVRPDIAHTPDGRRLLARGIARIAAVRDALGPARKLLVDCHWRLTETAAADLLRELEPFGLFWFECPLPEIPEMFPALRRLRSDANTRGIRTAGCEELIGLPAFAAFLDAGIYDAIMPDIKYVGGHRELLRVAAAAAKSGVICSPHNPSGPIAHVHSVHSSALLETCPFLEFQYGESPLFFDIVAPGMPDPRGGASDVPLASGLGARIDLERLSPVVIPPEELHALAAMASSNPRSPSARAALSDSSNETQR